MNRKEELIKYICKDKNNIALEPVIDEFLFIEEQLTELKKLPFIRVKPNNPAQQKSTSAAKQYKELLQQYTNILKILMKTVGTDATDNESPLRKWIKNRLDT